MTCYPFQALIQPKSDKFYLLKCAQQSQFKLLPFASEGTTGLDLPLVFLYRRQV